jgi:energy-coupling factor transporter ATP-binding protein EcfA2
MQRPHINTLRVQNYGCLKDVRLELTPLHALIGPNDSGKSTVLMALRTLTVIADGPIGHVYDVHRLVRAMHANPSFAMETATNGRKWGVSSKGADNLREALEMDGQSTSEPLDPSHGSSSLRAERGWPSRSAIAGSLLLRLEPDTLRESSQLIPEGQPLRFQNALGLGLPALYDAILTRDLTAYMTVNARFTSLFPTVKSLSLRNRSATEKELGIQLTDGTYVGVDFMSEGMLYYLAYAALPYLEPTAVILIEEPENGLHPARIHEVMSVLREISQTTQVILATHSPLVINELEPDEVTVLTRDPVAGTQARRIKDTPNFAERSKVYALGELWVSYSDGKSEAPLFKEPEPTPDPGDPVDWSDSAEP